MSFRLLMIDGTVIFHILEESPQHGADVVWEWEWDETGPRTAPEPSP